MSDSMSAERRSKHMAKIQSRGNRSTEKHVASKLEQYEISGWSRQAKHILGKPDFFFHDLSLVLFIDGCFWHGCSKCNRKIPQTNSSFWADKIASNIKRDRRVNRKLRIDGYHVMRVWEHCLKDEAWIKRLSRMIERIQSTPEK